MKIFKILRSQEWWSYKLPPLLAIGYSTAAINKVPVYQVAFLLLFLLCSLIIGAIYVSIINDITDLEEDISSGKSNRIQHIPAKIRWFIPIICLCIGCGFVYFMLPDLLSCSLYGLSWIVFSLYSINPVRLKNRGILGVFADGCGSHLFPSLLMVTSVSYFSQQQINWIWFISVGTWALCYGLRGILWHQFLDRDNDVKVNLNTYASKVDPSKFKFKSTFLISLELIAFTSILYQLSIKATFIGLLFYVILVLIRYRWRGSQIIIIIANSNNRPFQILMADYYQMFFPLTLLITASVMESNNITVLVIYIVLFPYSIWLAIQDYMLAFRIVFVLILNRLKALKNN